MCVCVCVCGEAGSAAHRRRITDRPKQHPELWRQLRRNGLLQPGHPHGRLSGLRYLPPGWSRCCCCLQPRQLILYPGSVAFFLISCKASACGRVYVYCVV